MDLNIVIGILGIILALCEIWKPRTALLLEKHIDNTVISIHNYKKETRSLVKQVVKNTEDTFKDVIKGPLLAPYEEQKEEFVLKLYNIRLNFLVYLAIFSYYFFLKPLKIIVHFLNFIGKGRAVGGIGLCLSFAGLLI